MGPRFRVRSVARSPLTVMHGMWPEDRQRALLTELLDEQTSLEGAELTEMLELALQDLEPIPCAIKLLETLLGAEMSKGMRDDVARAMVDGEPWVHHAQMSWHRAIYEAAWLAQAAHGGQFNRPHGSRVVYEVEALDDDAAALLDPPVTPALAARLVAPCMPQAILGRLFEDELAGQAFPDAAHVVWFAEWSARDGKKATLTIEGTDHWWGSAEPGEPVEVSAWPDRVGQTEA